MAFPGTYNFSYYKGDTFEFTVYPKKADGSSFDLNGFGTVQFYISTARGSDGVADRVEAFAQISDDKTFVFCAIKPATGIQLIAGTTYVYDVEITLPANQSFQGITRDYPVTYTLLTGNISITDHVSGAS